MTSERAFSGFHPDAAIVVTASQLQGVLGNPNFFAAVMEAREGAFDKLEETGRKFEVSYSVFKLLKGKGYSRRIRVGNKDGKVTPALTSSGGVLVLLGHIHNIPYTNGYVPTRTGPISFAPRVAHPGPSPQFDIPMSQNMPLTYMILDEQAFQGDWRMVMF